MTNHKHPSYMLTVNFN